MNAFWRYKLDHAVFWLLTIVFHAYTHSGLIERANIFQFILEIVVRNSLLAATIYTTLLFIIPHYFERKLYFYGVFSVLILVGLYVVLKNVHDYYLYRFVIEDPIKNTLYFNTFYNLSIILFYLAFGITLHLSKQWYLQQDLIKKIETEKLHTELEYLKAQINPHFLFNSINTIYFQIDKENKTARDTLSRFAEMLRYQLYECNGHEIPIEKEVSYLKNYVELQRIRKDESYDIQFHIEEVKNFTIPPLVIIPFIENAFKHVSHFNDKPNRIEIDLRKVNHELTLTVSNTVDHAAKEPSTGGIGLKNVKRRLDLLYGSAYNLTVEEGSGCYKTSLRLQLNSKHHDA